MRLYLSRTHSRSVLHPTPSQSPRAGVQTSLGNRPFLTYPPKYVSFDYITLADCNGKSLVDDVFKVKARGWNPLTGYH